MKVSMRLSGVLALALCLAGCRQTVNPWLSPVEVQIPGYCALMTGRIRADWGDKGSVQRVETARGVRYRLAGRMEKLPESVRIVGSEIILHGSCPVHPDWQEVSAPRTGRFPYLPPRFHAVWVARGKAQPLTVHAKGPLLLHALKPEKAWPWPWWPWTKAASTNGMLYGIGVETQGIDAAHGHLELKVCVQGRCGKMDWPATLAG